MQSGNTGRKAATESEWPANNSADKRVRNPNNTQANSAKSALARVGHKASA